MCGVQVFSFKEFHKHVIYCLGITAIYAEDLHFHPLKRVSQVW